MTLRWTLARAKLANKLILINRKAKRKNRISGLRLHIYIGVVVYHNFIHDIQPQAGAFSHRFGRKKWFKNTADGIAWYSGSVIGNGYFYEIAFFTGRNGQNTFIGHGIDGVINDVCPNLVQFAYKTRYGRQIRFKIQLCFNICFPKLLWNRALPYRNWKISMLF